MSIMHTTRIALAGNPNIGKTTLFNLLTGAHYTVGNWSGVTVEKKEGTITHNHKSLTFVDLPGTYSLSALSIDERIARDYLINESPDLILNLIDASNLIRNLYLTLQLLELEKPMIIALNMMDVAKANGLSINIAKLSHYLGVPIIPIVAAKGEGISELLEALCYLPPISSFKVHYNPMLETQLTKVMTFLSPYSIGLPTRQVALRIIEGDESTLDLLPATLAPQLNTYLYHPQHHTYQEMITDRKYDEIASLLKLTTTYTPTTTKNWTMIIDQFVTHKYLGFPIFILTILAVFLFTFQFVGAPLTEVFNTCFNYVLHLCNNFLIRLDISQSLRLLIVEGILSGIFSVLTFLPNIASLFIVLTFLEDSGYMARASFIMDALMKKLGLNGKSIIPMLLGFGCNVPAIMSTRTIENEKDRLICMLINPFFSCSARLPIYTLLASIFFPGKEAYVVASLYFLGILTGILLTLVFRKTLFKGDHMPFLMELPNYHLPTPDHMLSQVWDKVKGFIHKAGTTIFLASACLWLLLNYNLNGFCDMTMSFGAEIGKSLAPLLTPLGFGNWQAALALLSGIVGKEIIVSNFSIVYNLTGQPSTAAMGTLLSQYFTPLSAYSFLAFTLLYIPCLATLATIRRESNSLKWPLFSIILHTIIAWLISFIIYQIGSLFF